MKTLLLKSYQVLQNQNKHEISVYAAQASYFIIMAVFPIIMLLLNLIKFLPVSATDLIAVLEEMFPEVIAPLLKEIISDLYDKSSGTILSVSALTALWSASKGVISLEKGLIEISGNQKKQGFVLHRSISIFYTFAFIIIFIFSLVLLVFGNGIQMTLSDRFPMVAKITAYLISIRTLLSILILTLFFSYLYKMFPRRKAKLKNQLPGALFSTFGWMLFSFFFSIYVDNFGNFSYMYGSLTTIILLMLWLYVCIYIVFIGAEINMVFIPEQKEHDPAN